ncbi:MAG TPA: aminopeptidase P family protein [Acidimicrobiales bacterium]|nr:aminopeptidase P family protein [Acidimicrobiales bacterium]
MSEEAAIPEPDVSEGHPVSEHWVWVGPHRPPSPRVLFDHMTVDWAPATTSHDRHPASIFSSARRQRLAARFPAKTLVVPTGNFKTRANDTDYRFRAGTDFFYLTGCEEPDAVLVVSHSGVGANATLYVPHRRDSSTHEFYTDARYGELWVGPRRGINEAEVFYDVDTAPLENLAKDLVSLGGADVVTLRGLDASVDALHEETVEDEELANVLSELRLVKDDFEIIQLQAAIDYTVKGFEDVVRALPSAEARGERVIEGVFNLRARVEGNDVGYDTIAASGSHATTLHWTRNNGPVRRGDLLLLDAGVECDNLYTADVTRTMPVSGTFSRAQRRVYELVLAAQTAGIAAVKPGANFMAPHDAAMAVLAEGLFEMGILKEEPAVALRKDRQLHRRYTLHGTSHMLGLDVHDCANARNEFYWGDLVEGYVLTVEPGLYFQANDLTVPEEYRGIGVRIEDDVLVTASGAKNLSAALPREADEVEAWMARLWAVGPTDLGL